MPPGNEGRDSDEEAIKPVSELITGRILGRKGLLRQKKYDKQVFSVLGGASQRCHRKSSPRIGVTGTQYQAPQNTAYQTTRSALRVDDWLRMRHPKWVVSPARAVDQ